MEKRHRIMNDKYCEGSDDVHHNDDKNDDKNEDDDDENEKVYIVKDEKMDSNED